MSTPPRIAVIVASTREGRIGPAVAGWFIGLAGTRDDLLLEVIDLAHVPLPARLPAGHPSRGEYPEAVRPFAARIAAADGVVIVTPEYNHGYPGSLKDALDSVGPEWRAKPVAFVGYGGVSGGIRAVEQLRQVVAELHMASLRDAVLVPFAARAFRDGGVPADDDGRLADSVDRMLGRLGWWARALRAAREAAPYDG
ncbi:NADPH-dependent FMN reductase [Miltoncostaea oceani]|uniref:NADPH-dependent FMN reductase n=1 Tax=Miltoncostaea oceani TaxID=2843216 RepID=UPI002484BB29|nr:NAD(P)H-dependent oxidoreductase [Miltoncostaea oceani]